MRGPVFTRPLGSYGQCADHRFAEDVEKAVEKERAALRKNGTDADPLLANLAVLHEQTAAGGGAERPAGVAEAAAEGDDSRILRGAREAVRRVQRGAGHSDGGGREEQRVGEEPAAPPEPDPEAAGAAGGGYAAGAVASLLNHRPRGVGSLPTPCSFFLAASKPSVISSIWSYG